MTAKVKIENNSGVIVWKGKLMGPPDTEDLHTEILHLLAQNVTKIVLDITSLHWINSVGVGSLMRSFTSVKKKEGEIVLVGLSEKVRSIMIITQLLRVFKIYYSVEEAVNDLKGK